MTQRNHSTTPSPSPHRWSRSEADAWIDAQNLTPLFQQAAALRDQAHGHLISYSRKVFIPLTRLCRDVCHYCTFATTPRNLMRAFLTPEEVLEIARQGEVAGCKEALFTLGDKPERRYRVAREELAARGHSSTIDYLIEMCRRVLEETSLTPHVNPGVLDADELRALREVSISQGIMLESAASRLCERGGPHFGSPDKQPEVRLQTLELAGQLEVPFTTGILIGIGETRAERLDALFVLRDLHERYGHLQEIIIQNFRAKPGTLMADAPEPDVSELQWTIAVARMIFGAEMNLQAPPNLSPGNLAPLIDTGINDWGGVSPVTPDHVNPEAPWPHLLTLEEQTAACGKSLVERLAVYPQYARDAALWIDAGLRSRVLDRVDAQGLARVGGWIPGDADVDVDSLEFVRYPTHENIETAVRRAAAGEALEEGDIVRLFEARGPDFVTVVEAADC